MLGFTLRIQQQIINTPENVLREFKTNLGFLFMIESYVQLGNRARSIPCGNAFIDCCCFLSRLTDLFFSTLLFENEILESLWENRFRTPVRHCSCSRYTFDGFRLCERKANRSTFNPTHRIRLIRYCKLVFFLLWFCFFKRNFVLLHIKTCVWWHAKHISLLNRKSNESTSLFANNLHFSYHFLFCI